MLTEERARAERERLGRELNAAIQRKFQAEQAAILEGQKIEQFRGAIAGISLILGEGADPDVVNTLAWFSSFDVPWFCSLTLDQVAVDLLKRRVNEAVRFHRSRGLPKDVPLAA